MQAFPVRSLACLCQVTACLVKVFHLSQCSYNSHVTLNNSTLDSEIILAFLQFWFILRHFKAQVAEMAISCPCDAVLYKTKYLFRSVYKVKTIHQNI